MDGTRAAALCVHSESPTRGLGDGVAWRRRGRDICPLTDSRWMDKQNAVDSLDAQIHADELSRPQEASSSSDLDSEQTTQPRLPHVRLPPLSYDPILILRTGHFTTKVFHPNVNVADGAVCVSQLKKDWTPDLGIAQILTIVKWYAHPLILCAYSHTPHPTIVSSSTRTRPQLSTPKLVDCYWKPTTTLPKLRACGLRSTPLLVGVLLSSS